MVEWIRDILDWWTTGVLGLLLYWLPVAFCGVGYTVICWEEYRDDLKRRDDDKYFTPTITVGSIVGRAVITAIPVANLCAAIFHVAPRLFGNFIDWLGRVLSIPLVKPRKRQRS